MKNNIFKSFRFEIVLYSLLSLFYTLLTIAVVHVGVYIVYRENIQQLSGTSTVIISIITIVGGIIMFIICFLLLTKKFINYIREISEGINQISQGNLSNRIEIKNEDEFAFLADKLNQMADDIKEIMENERRIEYSKNELITSVAHDLRTPLTSIIGYLDLVSSKELNQETQMKYISIAYNKSKRLEKLIEDLFTYTKFNFGEVKASYNEVDMVKLLNQLVDEFYPSFAENHLDYEFITDNSVAVIRADGNLLARAFANLISNAIKYGKDGKNILINLYKKKDGIVITITNYGILIPSEDLDRIFRRFYRVESSRSSETGGSGLGLAIAQSIVEMHGGTIYAKSDLEGTAFTVELKNEPLN
ncbi:MAG: HAMP domain-containing sensor histidine kinase [Herbinix sp.]|nr:HAMP domain-containing sensor histidine kinase [Herbinix sp.]